MTRAALPLASKLAAILRVGVAAAVAYRGEFFIWILTTNMPLVMLALWTRVAADGPVGRFTGRGFASYFLAVLLVRFATLWFAVGVGAIALAVFRRNYDRNMLGDGSAKPT